MNQPALFSQEVLNPPGRTALVGIDRQQRNCKACGLAAGRTLVVLGEGTADSPAIMFVGEGPGANEDSSGRPFVGRAGQLLDKMLTAMNVRREDVYVTNVVGCRPPGNRRPEPEEIKACSKFLTSRVQAVRPRVLVALGATAAQFLTRESKPIGALRGRWYEFDKIPVRCTFHPAFLLRPEGVAYKKMAWEDLQEVLRKIEGGND